MARTTNQVVEKIIIVGEDKASAIIRQVTGEMGKMERQADSGFGGMAKKAALAAAATFAVKETAQKLFELSREGAAFADQFDVMSKRVVNFGNVINRAAEASAGLISDRALVSAANTFDQFGISLQEFDKVAAAVAKTAVRTGEDASVLFDKLAVGIGKLSPQRLDDLGIIIDDQKKLFDDYAKSIGKAGEALDGVEKRAAIAAESLRQMNAATSEVDIEGSRSGAFNRLSASFDNLTTSIGKTASNAIAPLADATADLIDQWTRGNDEVERLRPRRRADPDIDRRRLERLRARQGGGKTRGEREAREAAAAAAAQARREAEAFRRQVELDMQQRVEEATSLAQQQAARDRQAAAARAAREAAAAEKKRREFGVSETPTGGFLGSEFDVFGLDQQSAIAEASLQAAREAAEERKRLQEEVAEHQKEIWEDLAEREREMIQSRIDNFVDGFEQLQGIMETEFGETGEKISMFMGVALDAFESIKQGNDEANKAAAHYKKTLDDTNASEEQRKKAAELSKQKQRELGASYVDAAGSIAAAIASQIKNERDRAAVMAAVYAAQAIAFLVMEQYDRAALAFAASAAFGVAAATSGTSSGGGGGARGASATSVARDTGREAQGGGTTVFIFEPGAMVGDQQTAAVTLATLNATIANTGFDENAGEGL